MHSLKELYKIGRGPSSSHTIGPERAGKYVLNKYKEVDRIEVTLYGSLAKTGKGHRTDYAIIQTFKTIPCEVIWDTKRKDIFHPNTMEFKAYKGEKLLGTEEVYSIGGGDIQIKGEPRREIKDIYEENTFDEIAEACRKENISLAEYVYENEGDEIKQYLSRIYRQMEETIERGLKEQGVLYGGLNVKRRAKKLFEMGQMERNLIRKEHYLISAYAYATCEENASGETVVTAPTCGASGILPAVLYYERKLFATSEDKIIDALAIAGIIGLVIKHNASISGAECGCQAEVGSAISMAAAAVAFLQGMNLEQIECAAEIAMEHSLGLTCDPVAGLVQVPCIERNAVGALRAYDVASLSEVVYDTRKITFDDVVKTMYETGKDLSDCYRETSEGGLAKLYVKDFV